MTETGLMSSPPRAREDQLSEDLSNDARIVHGRDESRLRLGCARDYVLPRCAGPRAQGARV